MKNIQRIFFSTNRSSTSFKRLIPLLIKRVHPDLFGSYSEEVKNKNLKCAQTLNELMMNFDNIYSSAHNGHDNIISVNYPLNHTYDISASIKSAEEPLLINVSFKINPPKVLCSKSLISRQEANKAFQFIYKDFQKLFEFFNSVDEWNKFIEKENLNNEFKSKGFDKTSEDRINILETQKLIKDKLDKRIAQILINRKKNYHINYKGRDMNLLSEVETYFRRGNVLVNNLELLEEIQALQLLRHFFNEHGYLVNFRLETWCNVILIITVDNIFKTEVLKNRHIVYIPCKFKIKELLEYFRTNLPMADLLYEAADLDN